MTARRGFGRLAVTAAGFAGSALSAFFLGGPAILADGDDAERVLTVAAATAVWILLAAACGWLTRSPAGAMGVAAAALPIVGLLVAAEPQAWRIGALLALGIACATVAGTFAANRARRGPMGVDRGDRAAGA